MHVVVYRLGAAGLNVPEEPLELFLRFTREEGDAELDGFLELGRRLFQHRQDARDMEAAKRHLEPARPKLARDRQGARILIRLHANQRHKRFPSTQFPN